MGVRPGDDTVGIMLFNRPEFRSIRETDWLPGGDELTPTMKLKRKPIGDKYVDLIEELYADT